MSDHIDFVENVYETVKSPMYYILDKITQIRNITNGNTTSHNLDNRYGLPSGIDRYTAYIGNSSRGYNLAFNGYIDYLEILIILCCF